MKRRPDAYEAQLTPEELTQLHELLLKPDLAFHQMQAQVPPWRSGPYAGQKPSVRTLASIAGRLRTENRLVEMENAYNLFYTLQQKLPRVAPGLENKVQFKDLLWITLAQSVLEKSIQNQLTYKDAPLVRLVFNKR